MKIGIFVGHSRKGDQGAVSIGSVSEFVFNLAVAENLRSELTARGIASEVVHWYGGNSYGAAMSWVGKKCREAGFTAAIELHFNAASAPQANGHEFLFYNGSQKGCHLAAALAESFQHHFPFSRPRAEGGLLRRTAADRGSLFLRKTPCPAVILEPFFGSNSEEWDYFSANKKLLAISYADALAAWCRAQ